MKASHDINLDELGQHMATAKERLSEEKKDILKSYGKADALNREEYAFAYLRAERIGMQVINNRLAEIAWLPMQLDPRSELVSENRNAMKRWVTGASAAYPNDEDFGNGFIHALTRTALQHGWDDIATKKILRRIGNLFRDLSCLIGLIYFTHWLAERDVEGIALSDPDDLHRSVIEISAIVQSPELHRALRERAEAVKKAQAKKVLENKTAPKKSPPFLRLIRNDDVGHDHDFMPDPVMI